MSIDLEGTLDRDTKEAKKLLGDLQGNILVHHKREHVMHLFLCFGTQSTKKSHALSVAGARVWLDKLVKKEITTAAKQEKDSNNVDVFTTIMLSSAGYEYIGKSRPKSGAFREGMQGRRLKLRDAKLQDWDPDYKIESQDLHALVIIGASGGLKPPMALKQLNRIKTRYQKECKKFGGKVLLDQRGDVIRNNNGKGHVKEHFGYVDGVSQPDFFGDSALKKYNQNTPLKVVLTRDRHSDNGFGSYFVFRKLEQNVDSFNAAVTKVAKTLGIAPELAGAMAMGRFKNGTPVVSHDKPVKNYDPKKDEDFNYKKDKRGRRCPIHGHIRKANPRGSIGPISNIFAKEEERRIARRGITYTESKSVGLLFMCYQSDIADQFEFIQRRWANEKTFSRADAGLDPIIGQDEGANDEDEFPNWPKGYNSPSRQRIRFDQHVKLRGGEYFFAPCISGLLALTKD